ncbi:hypothetical protein BW899_09280 [Bacillus mycoides]|nr:hypothetical protein BW899_09280 [Bacillus mycoides]OUB66198.1 hypothetical protein BK744_27230 [Bacillus thuringiensis serovar zhaodongensis]
MDLYLNALKYAIGFEHNRIHNMSYKGTENNGLLHTKKIQRHLRILNYTHLIAKVKNEKNTAIL